MLPVHHGRAVSTLASAERHVAGCSSKLMEEERGEDSCSRLCRRNRRCTDSRRRSSWRSLRAASLCERRTGVISCGGKRRGRRGTDSCYRLGGTGGGCPACSMPPCRSAGSPLDVPSGQVVERKQRSARLTSSHSAASCHGGWDSAGRTRSKYRLGCTLSRSARRSTRRRRGSSGTAPSTPQGVHSLKAG